MSQDVVRALLVNHRCPFFLGFQGVQDEGVFLILYFQGTDGLVGGHVVFCDNGGNIIAVVADVLVQYFAVSDILPGRIGCPRMAGCRECNVGDIETSEDFDDSFDLLRLRCID